MRLILKLKKIISVFEKDCLVSILKMGVRSCVKLECYVKLDFLLPW